MLGHNARSQYYNGLLNQERYFTAFTDSSLVSAHKRDIVCGVVTKQANKLLKDDQAYYRGQNDDIASLVLHGIAPGVWENKWTAIPRPISTVDSLCQHRTLLGFSNLPFIYLRRDYTAMELEAVAKARKPDPGWNLDMVNRILEWLDREMTTLGNNVWPEAFKMEDWAELKKEGGMYHVRPSAGYRHV